MTILLKLTLAYLLSAFILKPRSWIGAAELKRPGAWQWVVPAALSGLLSFLFIGDPHFWPWAVALAFWHGVITLLTLSIPKRVSPRIRFFAGQGLQFAALVIVWVIYANVRISMDFLDQEKPLLLLTFLVLITSPVSVAIRIFISKWTPDTDSHDDLTSLQSAGQYIGILERLLVFVFMIANEWQAVGFLLAAKSVFRFGNLQEAHDRKLTEYILIGTLLSFGIAVLAGLAYRLLAA